MMLAAVYQTSDHVEICASAETACKKPHAAVPVNRPALAGFFQSGYAEGLVGRDHPQCADMDDGRKTRTINQS